MENQHRKIAGYRELSQAEINLMNRIKDHAEATRHLVHEIQDHLESKPFGEAAAPVTTEPLRWLAIARTELQQGYMALTRSVAQPTTF